MDSRAPHPFLPLDGGGVLERSERAEGVGAPSFGKLSAAPLTFILSPLKRGEEALTLRLLRNCLAPGAKEQMRRGCPLSPMEMGADLTRIDPVDQSTE
jgi:hypothetical protein